MLSAIGCQDKSWLLCAGNLRVPSLAPASRAIHMAEGRDLTTESLKEKSARLWTDVRLNLPNRIA
jgi:hypothetical protein